MDQEELQKTIAKYYQKLPPKLQESFASMKWLEIVRGIKDKNNLTDEQTETLSIETTLLLLGIINNEEYESNLRENIKLAEGQLDTILKEINAFILSTIQLDLRATFENNQDEFLVGEKLEAPLEKKEDKIEEVKINPIPVMPLANNENEKEGDQTSNIINSGRDYEAKVYAIGKENNLTISQITKLAEIVGDILKGKIFGDQFLGALSTLGVDEVKKNNIAKNITDKVFTEIRNQMMGKSEVEVAKKEEIKSEPIMSSIKKDPLEVELNNRIIEDKKIANSIISQKLTSTVKSNTVVSNHEIGEKVGEITKTIDPYREIPE